MRTAQAFERVGVPRCENAFLEHLGVSNVDFDPENESRIVQLARGVINRSFVQPLRDWIGVMISPNPSL